MCGTFELKIENVDPRSPYWLFYNGTHLIVIERGPEDDRSIFTDGEKVNIKGPKP